MSSQQAQRKQSEGPHGGHCVAENNEGTRTALSASSASNASNASSSVDVSIVSNASSASSASSMSTSKRGVRTRVSQQDSAKRKREEGRRGAGVKGVYRNTVDD